MANIEQRNAENVPGSFYVDVNCINCDLCRTTAPKNFTLEADKNYSFVFKQPENPEEEAQCKEAVHMCPVEAIGVNGL